MEKLTRQERSVLQNVVGRVIDNLQWDADEGQFKESYEDWMLRLDKDEMAALKKAVTKIRDL